MLRVSSIPFIIRSSNYHRTFCNHIALKSQISSEKSEDSDDRYSFKIPDAIKERDKLEEDFLNNGTVSHNHLGKKQNFFMPGGNSSMSTPKGAHLGKVVINSFDAANDPVLQRTIETMLKKDDAMHQNVESTIHPLLYQLKIFTIGLIGGSFGGFFGVGGAIVLIPLLTHSKLFSIFMNQIHAQGTASAAVVASCISGAISFFLNGSIDWFMAAMISFVAAYFSSFGVKMAVGVPDYWLIIALGVFMLMASILLPIRSYLLHLLKLDETTTTNNNAAEKEKETIMDMLYRRRNEIPALVLIGCSIGLLSGFLSVGGGVLLVPLLSIFTPISQQMIIGTSLASLILPSVIGGASHMKRGNMIYKAVPGLIIGSALGAFASSSVSNKIPEQYLQIAFSVLMVAMSIVQFRKGWSKYNSIKLEKNLKSLIK